MFANGKSVWWKGGRYNAIINDNIDSNALWCEKKTFSQVWFQQRINICCFNNGKFMWMNENDWNHGINHPTGGYCDNVLRIEDL